MCNLWVLIVCSAEYTTAGTFFHSSRNIYIAAIIHIPPGLRGLWRRKRSQSPLPPYRVFSGRPRQSIRVGRGQSASHPHLCPAGQEVGRREATAPRATPLPNTEKERKRDAAHAKARWVRLTLSQGICCLSEYLTGIVDTGSVSAIFHHVCQLCSLSPREFK